MEELGGGSIKEFLVEAGASDPMALATLSAKLAMKYVDVVEEPKTLEAKVYNTQEELNEELKRSGLPIPIDYDSSESQLEREQLIASNQALAARAKEAEKRADEAEEARTKALRERAEIVATVLTPAGQPQ